MVMFLVLFFLFIVAIAASRRPQVQPPQPPHMPPFTLYVKADGKVERLLVRIEPNGMRPMVAEFRYTEAGRIMTWSPGNFVPVKR
jgi:hypothetical protein